MSEAVDRVSQERPELRDDMRALDARLRAVEQGQAAMSAKLDLLIDKVVAKLPSWWQMPAAMTAMASPLGALHAAVQYLHAHAGWP